MAHMIDPAFNNGKAAYAAGIFCAPCMDPSIAAMIDGLKVGGGADKIMKAWIKGWTVANMQSMAVA
jgi:hypothetical protein